MGNGDFWVLRHERDVDSRLEFLAAHLKERGIWPIEIKIDRYRDARSLSQNALYQVWARQFARHLLKQTEITPDDHEDMKQSLIRHCYAETGWNFLVRKFHDLLTDEWKVTTRSTSDFKQGEMYQFMSWVQAKAADSGLILETAGEYEELKRGTYA